MSKATVIKFGALDMQVCVPADWTDEQVEEFANRENPSGLEIGWKIRPADSPYQAGAPVRVTCAKNADNVHIMLEC